MENSDQKFEFIFGENNNYHQIGNADVRNETTVGKDAADPAYHILFYDDATRLENLAFAYCFNEARLATTGGEDLDYNKYLGQTSSLHKAKNGTRRAQISRKPLFLDCVQMNKNAK